MHLKATTNKEKFLFQIFLLFFTFQIGGRIRPMFTIFMYVGFA